MVKHKYKDMTGSIIGGVVREYLYSQPVPVRQSGYNKGNPDLYNLGKGLMFHGGLSRTFDSTKRHTMKTFNTYERKTSNAVMIIFLYVILGVYSCFAQSFQRIAESGMQASLNFRGFKSRASADVRRLEALRPVVTVSLRANGK
jgi:hypothetical protein